MHAEPRYTICIFVYMTTKSQVVGRGRKISAFFYRRVRCTIFPRHLLPPQSSAHTQIPLVSLFESFTLTYVNVYFGTSQPTSTRLFFRRHSLALMCVGFGLLLLLLITLTSSTHSSLPSLASGIADHTHPIYVNPSL